MADLKAPGYWISTLGASYTFNERNSAWMHGTFMKATTLSLTLTNLSNTRYISTMGEFGNPMNAATGYSYQSVMPGAPRMVFGSIRAEF